MGADRGAALIVALMAIALVTAVMSILVLTTTTEQAIATNFQTANEALYAADAGIERAILDLNATPNWTDVLNGTARSGFVDGAPSGSRQLPGGATIDLIQVANLANCEKKTTCSAADMAAVTQQRPWGANNPRWQPYAYGRLSDMLAPGAINSAFYIVVFAGDDPSETDGDPARDAVGTNPGAGILSLRAEAFGPRNAHRMVEATVARIGDPALGTGVRLLSWRTGS
jgi:hypothetical protein